MISETNRALLIFAKNPEKGTVKTRLAQTLGEDKALQVYKKLLAHTRRVVSSVQEDKILWYSDFIPKQDRWKESEFTKKIQQGHSLGKRMQYAFAKAFEDGYEHVVIIGSDCAQIKPGHISQAYRQLKSHDIVVGPSRDGGYYLLGMNQYCPALFENKAWSTEKVLQQTLEECNQLGRSYYLLEPLNDVDTEADWQEIQDQIEMN